jgi:hypothetical protein
METTGVNRLGCAGCEYQHTGLSAWMFHYPALGFLKVSRRPVKTILLVNCICFSRFEPGCAANDCR